MLADLPGEDHVIGRDRRPIAPFRIRANGKGDGNAFARRPRISRRQVFDFRTAIFDRRQFRAEHADELPIRVVGRKRPQRHAEHIGFRQRRVDIGLKGRRKLDHADHQLILGMGGSRRGDRQRHCRKDGEQDGEQGEFRSHACGGYSIAGARLAGPGLDRFWRAAHAGRSFGLGCSPSGAEITPMEPELDNASGGSAE